MAVEFVVNAGRTINHCGVLGKIKKMQLDVDIEPTLRFPHMTSIDRQMDKSEGSYPLYMKVL